MKSVTEANELAEIHRQIKYLDKPEVLPETQKGEEFLGI